MFIKYHARDIVAVIPVITLQSFELLPIACMKKYSCYVISIIDGYKQIGFNNE